MQLHPHKGGGKAERERKEEVRGEGGQNSRGKWCQNMGNIWFRHKSLECVLMGWCLEMCMCVFVWDGTECVCACALVTHWKMEGERCFPESGSDVCKTDRSHTAICTHLWGNNPAHTAHCLPPASPRKPGSEWCCHWDQREASTSG